MKFLTGIDIFDTSTGGIYPGLIILAEEVGAGGREFALTSLMNLSAKDVRLYIISVILNEEETRRELKLIFPDSNPSWIDRIKILSLSKEFFAKTIVPAEWVSEKGVLASLKSEKILEKLVSYFDDVEDNSIVFVDSLTDLIRKTEVLGGDEVEWSDLIDLLIGLRKLVIRKNILLYILFSKEIVDKGRAEEIFYYADGVLMFEWDVGKDVIKRWMYIKKLFGILPQLEKQRLMRYEIGIDPANGFTISKLHRIL
jgi:hypothetical protein